MTTDTQTYIIRHSEKCYRFKPDAFCSHAPTNQGIYELVTFNDKQEAQVLYVGAAFNQGIRECLEAHAAGTLKPTSDDIFSQYPNLYFDYLTDLENVKTLDDAKNVYWWLVQKHKPVYNDITSIQPARPASEFTVQDID